MEEGQHLPSAGGDVSDGTFSRAQCPGTRLFTPQLALPSEFDNQCVIHSSYAFDLLCNTFRSGFFLFAVDEAT